MLSNFKIIKGLFVVLFLGIITSCIDKKKETTEKTIVDTVLNTPDTAFQETSKVNNAEVSIDFCTDCKDLETWIGGIQGVELSDSTKVYPFGECHTNLSYDLIWVPRGDILKFNKEEGQDKLLVYYEEESLNNKYSKLDCFSFVIPKKKKKPTARDNATFSYVFPSEVKVYKRTDNKWAVVGTKNIKSVEQLGRLKLDAIFNKAF